MWQLSQGFVPVLPFYSAVIVSDCITKRWEFLSIKPLSGLFGNLEGQVLVCPLLEFKDYNWKVQSQLQDMQYSFSSFLAILTLAGVTMASPAPAPVPAASASPATTSPPVSKMDFGIVQGTGSATDSCYLFAVWGSCHTTYGPIGDLTTSAFATGPQTTIHTAPSVACNWGMILSCLV